MAEDRMAVLDTVRKAIGHGDVDFLREGLRVLAQAVMEAEVTELTGVPHRDPLLRRPAKRSPDRPVGAPLASTGCVLSAYRQVTDQATTDDSSSRP